MPGTVRNWSSHPAELEHSSTGEVGASWQHRGYNPYATFGVHMAGAGWGKASGFTRTQESYASDLAWMFDGISGNVLGERGYVLGGAAGDELDIASAERGSPPYARVVLTSRHGDKYFPALERQTEIGPNLFGEANADLRADVTWVAHPGRGTVFSASSICWAGSMAYNDYDNDIARLTTNVLHRLLAS